MAMMVGFGVASIGAGRRAVRVRGATRDIFASIRHARSVALVAQQPSVITYSTTRVDDEVCAKIEVNTAKIFDSNPVKYATTLQGERVALAEDDGPSPEGDAAVGGSAGETMDTNLAYEVVHYIDSHAEEGGLLSTLSREFGYSYDHISRRFAHVTGESLRDYYNRRRRNDFIQRCICPQTCTAFNNPGEI